MAKANDSGLSDRDTHIVDGLDELRRKLWRADAIIAMVRTVLETGTSDRDLTDDELDQAGTALEMASVEINTVTAKMEGKIFLRGMDAELAAKPMSPRQPVGSPHLGTVSGAQFRESMQQLEAAGAALAAGPASMPSRSELRERINAVTLRLEQGTAIVKLAARELVQAADSGDAAWGCALCAAEEILQEVAEQVSGLSVSEQTQGVAHG